MLECVSEDFHYLKDDVNLYKELNALKASCEWMKPVN